MEERDTAARNELWVQFVDHIREQLALKEAKGELEQTSLDEPLTNELTLAANTNYLGVWLHPETGEGSWNNISKHEEIAERWFMSTEGTVLLSGAETDITGAAEIFVQKICPR